MKRRRVLVADPISQKGLEILASDDALEITRLPEGASRDELLKYLKEGEFDALIVRGKILVDKEVLNAGIPSLKVVGRAGAGLDNIDAICAKSLNIAVLNANEGNAQSTAEHTVGLMLALAHNIVKGHSSLRKNLWEREKFLGSEIFEKTLGVIGLGAIGSKVAHIAKAFNMRVIACDPYIAPEKAKEVGAEIVSLDSLLARSDFISLHIPLNEETRNILSKEKIAHIKPGAFVINCSRGGLIDESALYEALKNGKLKGAGLDVFQNEPPKDSPLLSLDNVVVTPHIGGSAKEAKEKVGEIIAEKIRQFFLYRSK